MLHLFPGLDLSPLSDVATFIEDHDYGYESIDEFALVYVAGYTARKSLKFTAGCPHCDRALKLQNEAEATDEHLLIKLKSRGYLTYPSQAIINLLRFIERHVINTAKSNEFEENILFLVVENLEKHSDQMPTIGCDNVEHRQSLTKAIAKFFLIMRMHFLCKRWNKLTEEQKKKRRVLRKQAHQT